MHSARISLRKFEFISSRYKEHKLSKDDFRRIIAVRRILPKIPVSSIFLDVGCYDGTIGSLLRPNGVTVIGLELSKNAALIAKGKIDEVIICDVEESLPFRDNSCDLIYMGELIEHLFDPDYFLEEARRVLSLGGYLIVTTPNLASLGSRISLLLGRKPWMIEERIARDYAGHIRYYTVDTLRKLIEEHHFVVEKVTSEGVKLWRMFSSKLGEIIPTLGLHIIICAKRIS